MNVTPYKIYIYLVVCCIVNFDLFPGVRTTYPVISTIKETPGPEEICENFEEKIREIGAGGRGRALKSWTGLTLGVAWMAGCGGLDMPRLSTTPTTEQNTYLRSAHVSTPH